MDIIASLSKELFIGYNNDVLKFLSAYKNVKYVKLLSYYKNLILSIVLNDRENIAMPYNKNESRFLRESISNRINQISFWRI